MCFIKIINYNTSWCFQVERTKVKSLHTKGWLAWADSHSRCRARSYTHWPCTLAQVISSFWAPSFLFICALTVPLTGRKFTILQGSWCHCWSAYSKVKSFFCNLCPSLTLFIIYPLSLVVPSGITQISLLPLRTLENSCHTLFKTSLLVVRHSSFPKNTL